jgi:protein-S-isoprenylcysteine O-methyltransferase Ste14
VGPLLKTALFTVFVPGFVAGWVPLRWVAAGAHVQMPAAAPLIAVGVIVYLWCAWDFVRALGTPAPIDPPKRLVARGLYRRVRNPMYLGVLLTIFGEALLFASIPLAEYGAFVAVCFHLFVVLYEEPSLRRRFGPDYEEYLRTVPRWLPRV